MPNPNDLTTNLERIKYVQGQLVQLPDLIRACEGGQVIASGESIEIPAEAKGRMKQKVVKAKVNCITALNAVKL